jgi:hypothetical protein
MTIPAGKEREQEIQMPKENGIQSSNPGAASRGTFMIQRRDFLRLGSVAAVGIATSAMAGDLAGSVTGVLAPQSLPLLSIGFLDGSLQASGRRVVAAESLSSGDRDFLRAGAALRIAGFWRAETHRATPLSIGVNVHYPNADAPEGRTGVLAWACSSHGRTASAGRTRRLAMPVDETHQIELSVDGRSHDSGMVKLLKNRLSGEGSAPKVEETFARLSLSTAGGAKLRRGVYFLAVRESPGDRAPNWSAVRAQAPGSDELVTGSGGPLVDLLGRPVSFSYVVLSAEPATA